MKVAVAILNWNGKKWLEQFLPFVTMHSQTAEIYIIDNASTDDSINFLCQTYPHVKQIILDKNYGFAEGYNKGLAQIAADYYILLNSDVQPTSHWIEPIIQEMEKNPKLAICMPKIKSYSRPDFFEYAGAAGGYIDKFGYPFCRGRLFDYTEKDNGQYNTNKDIFWASGAALFVKSAIYKELGGLDGDFFAHMEEIDFCWRAKNAGYTIQCIYNSEILHVGGGSLPQNNPFKTYLNYRNNLYMLHKNLPSKSLKKTLFKRKLLDGLSWLNFIIHGDTANAKEIIHAHKDYRKAIPLLNNKRECIQQKELLTGIYQKSIIWQYFVLRKKTISL